MIHINFNMDHTQTDDNVYYKHAHFGFCCYKGTSSGFLMAVDVFIVHQA